MELGLCFFLRVFTIENKPEKTPYLPSTSTAAKSYTPSAFWGPKGANTRPKPGLQPKRGSEGDAEWPKAVHMVHRPYVRHI